MATCFQVPLLSTSLPGAWLSGQCSPSPVSASSTAETCWAPPSRHCGHLWAPLAVPFVQVSNSHRLSAAAPCPTSPWYSLRTHQPPRSALQQRVLRERCVLASCSSSNGLEVAEEGTPPDADNNSSIEDGSAEKRTRPEIAPRPWPRPAAADLVASYRREVAHQGGHLVIQPLEAHCYEATVDLLALCFADSIDAASLLGYIRSQIVKYLREQERFFAKGQGVCLVALWSPEALPTSDTPAPAPAPPTTVVGTVSLAFAVRSLPRFPTLNVPGDRSNAYLSNMAVQPSHRRRGVARELLAASEELSAALGKRALFLHVRFVDEVPQRVYSVAGYTVVARDTILSWLFLQRRRSLMRKQLPRTPFVDTSIRVQDNVTA